MSGRTEKPVFLFRVWIGLLLFALWAYAINRAIKGVAATFVTDEHILQQVGGVVYLVEYLATYPLIALFVGGLVRLAFDHWRNLRWRGEFGELKRAPK